MQRSTVRAVATISTSLLLLGLSSACGGKVILEAAEGGAGGTSSQTSVGKGVGTSGTSVNGTGVAGTSDVGTSVTSVSAVGTSVTSVSAVGSTGSGLPPTNVSCNGAPCNPGEICCFNPVGPGDQCGQSGQCPTGFVELSCNGPEDCPGGVCCGTINFQAQAFEGISCQPSCNGMGKITICSQQDPTVCPPGTQCHKSNQLGDGYRVCF